MSNFIVVLLIIAVCFYYGILYTNGKILLLGFAFVLLLLVSMIELIYRYVTLKSQIEIPISIAEEDVPVKIGFSVKNNSLFPTSRIKFCIEVKNVLEKKGKSDWISISNAMPKQERFDFEVVLKSVGNHAISIKKMRIYALTGLFFVTKKCKSVGNILVMPKIYPIGVKITERTRHFVGDVELYDDTRFGYDASEVFEIRNYQPKDKLQNIHWKLSAKMDDLMVRENSMPKACSIVLLAEIEQDNISEIDAFLECVASLSFALMDAKCPHFVAWYSKEKNDIVRIRVDDEESYYLFLNYYLVDVTFSEKRDIRMEYREKYKGELYLHDLCVKGDLQIYQNGEFLTKVDAKKIEDACKELELLL